MKHKMNMLVTAGFVSVSIATSGQAQDIPPTITPAAYEGDFNGVNLATGKVVISGPVLAVPASPNLRFDRVENAVPTMTREQTGAGEGLPSRVSVHFGGYSSDAFKCIDRECIDQSGKGSEMILDPGTYTQSGSGARYKFDKVHYKTSLPFPVNGSGLYEERRVASSITYPNGERILITYETGKSSNLNDPRTLFKPVKLASNSGYFITISYQATGSIANISGWSVPSEAAMYSEADPSTPLGKLTFSGATITDISGRVYACDECSNGFVFGYGIEVSHGSLVLPGETLSTFDVAGVSTDSAVVGQVSRDGVIHSYEYENLRTIGSVKAFDKVTIRRGNETGMSYVAEYNIAKKVNRIKSFSDQLSRKTSFLKDFYGQILETTLPEGNKLSYTYRNGMVASETLTPKPGTGLPTQIASLNYGVICNYEISCWRPIWHRDAKGNQTDFLYNTRGQLIEQTDPADAAGVRKKSFISYALSPAGISRKSVVRICGTGAACSTLAELRTEYEYWGNTMLASIERRVDPVNNQVSVTSFTYDTAGRLLVRDGSLAGADDAEHFRYDILGRQTWEIGPKNANGTRRAKRHIYRDADDKIVSTEIGTVLDPASTALRVYERTDLLYDSRRNVIREVASSDGLILRVLDHSYNDRSLKVCTALRMNLTNLPAFNDTAACNLGSEGSHGPDRITKLTYDAAGQLIKTTVAFGTPQQADEETNTYTLNGKLAIVTDGENNRTTFEYDGHDRLLKTRYPLPTLGALASSTTDYEGLTYDANGNVTQRRLRDGQVIAYSYDALNRQTYKDLPGAEADVSTAYDLMGRPTNVVDSASNFSGYAYDALGRMTAQSSPLGVYGMGYDAAGRRTLLVHPDNFYVNYDYDATGNVTKIRENGAISGVGLLATYAYDALGRRASLTRGNGTVTSFTYDGIGRLASLAHDTAGTISDVTTTLDYNPSSQVMTYSRNNDSYKWNGHYNISRAYGTNGLNQLTTAGATALGYDGRGNLTSSGASLYTYSNENRMLTGPGGATLAYDPVGRLGQSVGTNSGASVTTRFGYDGTEMVAEYGATGTLLRRYVHGPADDDPLVWYEGSGTTDRRWLHADERGSITGVSNSAGTSIAINAYDEYGIPASTNMGRFGYTGQTWIAEIGMNYYKARMYSPTLGRFMQTDPIGYKDGVNWYDYVANDPVNKNDPDGKSGVAVARGVLGWIAADVAIPEPTDAAWPKWAGYAVAGVVATGVIWVASDNSKDDKVPAADRQVRRSDNGGPPIEPKIKVAAPTQHGQQRSDQARAGDNSRQVGDPNRVVREGRTFRDTETGNTVNVNGNRVVVTNAEGQRVTQWSVQTSANTQGRIRNGKWEPQ